MLDPREYVELKIKYLDELISKLENKENVSICSVLENEMRILNATVQEYQKEQENKKVINKEETSSKKRYYLKDGSVYVVKGREYRYLYDASTKVVTYEFENGQVERTFPNGLKEIRQKNGCIIIKNGQKEYDYINST